MKFSFEKVRENDTRKMTSRMWKMRSRTWKMTSRTRKTSSVAFQTLRFEKKYGKMKCRITSCTRKTSNVASYVRFTEF